MASESTPEISNPEPDAASSTITDTGVEPAQQSDQSTTDGSADTGEPGSEDKDWKAEADKWKNLARKHQERSKGADKVRAERDELREQMAQQDVTTVQTASSVASERLATRLARAGLGEEATAALVGHIDPMSLLSDGAVSDEAIEQVAASLAHASQPVAADIDQGQRSTHEVSADDWLRRKARNS